MRAYNITWSDIKTEEVLVLAGKFKEVSPDMRCSTVTCRMNVWSIIQNQTGEKEGRKKQWTAVTKIKRNCWLLRPQYETTNKLEKEKKAYKHVETKQCASK